MRQPIRFAKDPEPRFTGDRADSLQRRERKAFLSSPERIRLTFSVHRGQQICADVRRHANLHHHVGRLKREPAQKQWYADGIRRLFFLCGTFMLSPLLCGLMCIAFGLVIAWLRALIPPFHGPMRRQAPPCFPDGPKTPTCVSRPQDLSRDDALLGPRGRQSTRRRSQSDRLLVGHHERALGPPRAACMHPPAPPPRLFRPFCSICPSDYRPAAPLGRPLDLPAYSPACLPAAAGARDAASMAARPDAR